MSTKTEAMEIAERLFPQSLFPDSLRSATAAAIEAAVERAGVCTCQHASGHLHAQTLEFSDACLSTSCDCRHFTAPNLTIKRALEAAERRGAERERREILSLITTTTGWERILSREIVKVLRARSEAGGTECHKK